MSERRGRGVVRGTVVLVALGDSWLEEEEEEEECRTGHCKKS